MERDKSLKEQEQRAKRVADKEKLIIENMGYENAFKAVSAILCDYDRELIYDGIISLIKQK